MDYVIKADQLGKRYRSQRDRPALDEVNLSIPRGQLYGLLGPDGAGKTTALRLLSTVMIPSTGRATVANYDVVRQAEQARRHIGYMPQNFSLYRDLSVRENLNFFADINQVPAAEKGERIDRMLAFTRLDRFQGRRAGKLSGGMKKKLALACALVHNPQVLLLDEPSTGVDPVSRRELWIMLADVVHQGVTVLVSTPYMDEAERCHQVGMLYQGQLLTSGAPEALEAALPFHIVEVKARPRKVMRDVIDASGDLLDWRPVGDRLRLAVNGQTQKVIRDLGRQLKKEGAEVRVLREAKRTMEDVFVHLVRQERKEA